MSIVSFIPNTILYKSNFRILFLISILVVFIISIIIQQGKDFIKRHSAGFLYAKIFIIQIFFLILEKVIAENSGQKVPYTLITGFLLIQPLITIDRNVHKIICSIITCTLCIIISFLTKPTVTAINDFINCVIFTGIGLAIGITMQAYIIDYIDMLLKKKEEDVQVAKKASKAKSEFLALVSHELRTPLNTVSGFNEMILRELTQKEHEPNSKEILDYSNKIKTSCKTLTYIISDILDSSKINSGELSLISVEYKLDTIINDLLNMIVPSANEKGLKFNINIKEDTPNCLAGDDMRLKQCLMNLLVNAIKYTNEGEISLGIDWKPSKSDKKDVLLTFSVSDTGTGIKHEDITKITSPFERLDEMKKRGIDGTGLGLSIVEGILKKMGSQLNIKSEYGIGSCFFFTISQPVIKDIPIGKYNVESRLSEQGEPSIYRSFIAPKARILVVDDMQMNLALICALLKCTQMQIDTAASGKKALELINLYHYNVVFIDHLMPVMDGIETLHAIRIMNISNYADTKYICLTANAAKDSKQLYLNEGFDDYISKPVDCEELESLLIRNLPPELVTLIDSKTEYKENEFLLKYKSIKGINYNAAIKYCKTAEILESNVRIFCEEINSRMELIKDYLAKEDMKNYTITVHALKTALKLIGLTELSDKAAYLEQCGTNNDKVSAKENTESFLSQLSQKADILKQTGFRKEKELPPISEEDYKEAMDSLKECAIAEDFKSAERIVKMMAEYKLPDKDSEMLSCLNQAIRNKNAEFFKKLTEEGVIQ